MEDSQTKQQPKYYNEFVRDSIYKYRENNKDKCLEINRKSHKKWYEANKDKRKAQMREYYYRKKQEKLDGKGDTSTQEN